MPEIGDVVLLRFNNDVETRTAQRLCVVVSLGTPYEDDAGYLITTVDVLGPDGNFREGVLWSTERWADRVLFPRQLSCPLATSSLATSSVSERLR